jgi:hypothetical protein
MIVNQTDLIIGRRWGKGGVMSAFRKMPAYCTKQPCIGLLYAPKSRHGCFVQYAG